MRQEEDSKILSKLGKKSGFTTPENYFNDFAKNLAEKLSDEYEIEVLTTKAVSYEDWDNYYDADEEDIRGVHVRRFPVAKKRQVFWMKVLSKLISTFRMNSRWLSNQWVKAQGPYTPALIRYIREHKDRYDVFVFVTYLYYPAVKGLPVHIQILYSLT